MAYGRRPGMRRRTTNTRRRPYRRVKRKVAVPRAPRKTAKQSAAVTRRRNAMAINQLAAQVAALKRRDWGPIQCSHQLMTSSAGQYEYVYDNDKTNYLPDDFNWTNRKMIRDIEVERNRPLLFDVNNYDCAIWKPDAPGVNTPQGGYWSHAGCNVFSVGTEPDTNLHFHYRRAGFVKAQQATHANSNPFWDIGQVDLVNGKPYKPLSCTYKFEIRGRPVAANTYVTFTLFTQRANTNDLSMDRRDQMGATQMPMALEHCRGMDDNTNMFNPKYFKVYFKKKFFLNSQQAGSVHPTDNWQREGQTVRDDDDNMVAEEDGPAPGDPVEGPPVPEHPVATAVQSEYIRRQTVGIGTTSNIRRFSFTVKPKHAYVPKYGSMIGNHVQVNMEPASTYNRDELQQAYQSPTGEIAGGNYGIQTIETHRPLWLLISTSDRDVTINSGVIDEQTRDILDNQIIVTCSRYCKWRDGDKESQASAPFHHTLTGLRGGPTGVRPLS